MRDSIVVICPTEQGEMRAALWHDGKSRMGGLRALPVGQRVWVSKRCPGEQSDTRGWSAACDMGLESPVSKRRDRRDHSGRSPDLGAGYP
jgi:hypothetical protein